ncbi:DUF6233 domain-containing protein [Streptomyces sp. NPDC058964]|uniref:DUF6233 domain-containing protein n=1 Tax=Streptomyces sp. NPDC058964 TaxID=3346681 RepID=UPI0036988741
MSREPCNAAPTRRGRRALGLSTTHPRPPEWTVELGIGTADHPSGPPRRLPLGRRALPTLSRDEARRLLATGPRACTHCRPDARLGILDSALPSSRRARDQFSDGTRAVISLAIR